MHRAEKQHVVVLTDDFASKRLHEVRSDRMHGDRALFNARVGNHADFGVFERDQIHRVHGVRNAVDPEHVARHVKGRDLFAAVAAHHDPFHEAETHDVKRAETIARAVKRSTAFDAAALRNEILEPFDLFERQADRQTGIAHVAVGTGDAKRGQADHELFSSSPRKGRDRLRGHRAPVDLRGGSSGTEPRGRSPSKLSRSTAAC